ADVNGVDEDETPAPAVLGGVDADCESTSGEAELSVREAADRNDGVAAPDSSRWAEADVCARCCVVVK
ncbi:hypothetical protein EV175_006669, partial [Coemansia sp. RSA 1933]